MSAVVCGTLAYSAMEPGILSKTGASGDETKESNEKVGQEQKNSKVLSGNLTLNAASFELAKSKIQAEESGKPNRLPQLGENEVLVDLWGSADMIEPIVGSGTYDSATGAIQINGSEEWTHWVFSGFNSSGELVWPAKSDETYTFTGHVEASGTANVLAVIYYVNLDNGQVYSANNVWVRLEETTGFADDFNIDTTGVPDGTVLGVGFAVSNCTEATTITATNMGFYYKYKSFAAEKWTPENDLPGLGISQENALADNGYIVKCEDGVTTLGVYYN